MKNANQTARSRGLTMHRRVNGFTLVELIIVITIVGILMSAILIGLRASRTKAKVNKIKSEMKLYGTAFKEFKNQSLFSSSVWPSGAGDGTECLTPVEKTVPDDVRPFWKNGTTSDFCYYQKNFGSTYTTTEVGLVWPGLDNNSADINDLDAITSNGNIILILHKPSITGLDASDPDYESVKSRIDSLDDQDKNTVIYLDSTE